MKLRQVQKVENGEVINTFFTNAAIASHKLIEKVQQNNI